MAKQELREKVEMIVAKYMFNLEGELAETFKIESFDGVLNEKDYNVRFDAVTDIFTKAIKKYKKETA
jgi:hypothetical protein